MQDRERLLALPLVPENNSHSTNYKNNPPAPPPPPAPGVAGILTSSTSVVSDSHTASHRFDSIRFNSVRLVRFFPTFS